MPQKVCETCKEPVIHGRFCAACAENIVENTRSLNGDDFSKALGSTPLQKAFSAFGIFAAGVFILSLFASSGEGKSLSDEKRMTILHELGAPSDTKIIAFVADYCGACRVAESRLNAKGIPYFRADLQKHPKAREVFNSLPSGFSRAIPTFVAGNRVMVGYNEGELLGNL